jgi:[ribosomal protein S5]-alanine N-acetyltransferase
MDYRLIAVDGTNVRVAYDWAQAEPHRELFSCRPVTPLPPLEDYARRRLSSDFAVRHRYLAEGSGGILGEIFAFDHNPRNRSAELGYYMPPENRGRGLGSLLLSLFLAELFRDGELALNKAYATTFAGNVASVGMLEGAGFRLDGCMREHYWVGDKVYGQCIYSMLRLEWEAGLGRDEEPPARPIPAPSRGRQAP